MNRDLCASFSFAADPEVPGNTFHFEHSLVKQGFSLVAGVDEAGRGPLAGPVVAGCVILPPDCEHHRFKDSKKLTARKRDELFAYLHICGACIGVSVVDAREIEQLNILQASLLAMKKAIHDCMGGTGNTLPDFLLVDGTFTVPLPLPQQTLTRGESKSASIAAASIIAKVTRDRLMARYHEQFPVYNFLQNKGYPTKYHRLAIAEYGPCILHRRTFKGVREFIKTTPEAENPPEQRRLW